MDYSTKTPLLSLQSLQTVKLEDWDYEALVSTALELRQMKDQSQWALGFLALTIEKKYSQNTLGKFAKEIGIATNSLEVYRWTVKKYLEDNPDFQPISKLSFSVYSAVANLPPPQREAILAQADAGDFSVERLRLERDRYGHPEKKQKPRFTLKFCEIHQKWQVWYSNIDEWEAPHE